jgi:hypothetical protein
MEIFVWVMFWGILALILLVPLAIAVGGLALLAKAVADMYNYLFRK